MNSLRKKTTKTPTHVQGSDNRKPGIKVPHHCAKFLGIRHKGAKCPPVIVRHGGCVSHTPPGCVYEFIKLRIITAQPSHVILIFLC